MVDELEIWRKLPRRCIDCNAEVLKVESYAPEKQLERVRIEYRCSAAVSWERNDCVPVESRSLWAIWRNPIPGRFGRARR